MVIEYPRLGSVRFDLHTSARPAMVVENGRDTELVFHVDHDDELSRRITGRTIRYGDDPDYSRHDYSLPKLAWFSDSRGAVCLVSPNSRRTSLGQVIDVKLAFRFAIETDTDGVRYDRIHVLRSRLQGLEEWMPIGSVSHERLKEGDSGPTDLLKLRRRDSVQFSRRLNATVRPAYEFTVSPMPGQSVINDRVEVETRVGDPRAWDNHLELHHALRDLLVVSGWQNYETQ